MEVFGEERKGESNFPLLLQEELVIIITTCILDCYIDSRRSRRKRSRTEVFESRMKDGFVSISELRVSCDDGAKI